MKAYNSTLNVPTTPMKRTPMSRGQGLLRKRATARARSTEGKLPAHLSKAKAGASTVFRSEAYLAAVRSIPCVSCDIEGHTQAAHSNQLRFGKGRSQKASDASAMALCGPFLCMPGCHADHDQGGNLDKATRNRTEAGYIRETIARLIRAGKLVGNESVFQSILNFDGDVEEAAAFLVRLVETEQLQVAK